MIRILFALLMSIGFAAPASATTVTFAPNVTTHTINPDSVGMDVTYDWSYAIGAGGSVSWGIFDVAQIGNLSLNVGATALPGSSWSQLELVTFDAFGNFMNTTGVLSLASFASSGGYTWDLDFSQVRDQAYTAFFYDDQFRPATGPGFFGLTAYDPQTVVSPPPSPVPLPAAAWMLIAGVLSLFGIKLSRRRQTVGLSSRAPAVPRMASA